MAKVFFFFYVFPSQFSGKEKKNINLTKIIFQRYENMHVFIIYYINRYSYSFFLSHPNPRTPHSGAVGEAAAKTLDLKRKSFLKTITKGAAAAFTKEREKKKKSFSDDF